MGTAAQLKAFFDSPRFNIWGSGVSAILEVLSWFTIREWTYATQVLFLLTTFFLARLAWTQFWEAERYRQNAAPKFDIVFMPDDTSWTDSRPYFQVMNFGMHQQMAPMVEMKDRRYRVGIQNLSAAVVPSVCVKLAKCTPRGNFIHVGNRLVVTDSDPPRGEADLTPVAGEPSLWFDVVNECDHAGSTPRHFQFCYAIPSLRQPVTHSLHNAKYEYEIVLRAEGGGYSCERAFLVSKEWQHGPTPLVMKPL